MHLQCTMSSIFDWEVHLRRLGMRDTLKHGTITVSGLGYFHKNCRFLWGKNVSKTLGRTIHYTNTSYDKQFRLWMVSEELRHNEIGLFLQQYRCVSHRGLCLQSKDCPKAVLIFKTVAKFTKLSKTMELPSFSRINRNYDACEHSSKLFHCKDRGLNIN